MERKQKIFYSSLIVSTLIILSLAANIYIRQLNKTISINVINSVSEMAAHDKAAIQAHIEGCWEDLDQIIQRLVVYDCETIEDVEIRLNLEQASSRFTHIYLIGEDGTIYTDEYVTYVPDKSALNRNLNFFPYFADGRKKVVARFDGNTADAMMPKESILYGIRLENFKIDGIEMAALIGISDIFSIQNNLVIDSFIKNGEGRGHSALIDHDGYYIVNINKKISPNRRTNLYDHLSESANSELTNEEVAQKLENRETFGFYHIHVGEKNRELFYFIPFEGGIDLYFIMSLNEEVFKERSNAFTMMGMTMLVICILTVVSMLLVVMKYQTKTIRASEKAKSQKEFLSNMSHEIRTPLNGLIGINHLIMAHIDNDDQKPQIKEWLKKSHSTANYLLSLVNDVLDMSKLQAGKVDLVNEPLLVSELFDEIVAMQTDNIESRGVKFIVEKDILVPCIEGDSTHTKQILMNIVGNAAKFTPEGKYIRFSVRQEKTDDTHVSTIYQCKDTGIGISKEYIDKIFDSFSQERNRNTNGIKGTGLGMAISKLLANAMGGHITVESELNEGSTFTVTIPSLIIKEIPDSLKEDNVTYIAEDTKSTVKVENGSPMKILVAEDVELNAEILLEILAMEGFETVHAENGKEAVKKFQESAIGEFDIILMDMQMPIMDGCTASREIRKLDREDAQTVIIYACTANTFQEDRDIALKSGMNDFLTKPIDIDILMKKIAKIKQ